MANCNLAPINTNDFASDGGAVTEAMDPTQMAAGLECGQLNIGRVNWLFMQLFAAVSSLTTCLQSICDIFTDPATAATNGELVVVEDLAGNVSGYMIAQ